MLQCLPKKRLTAAKRLAQKANQPFGKEMKRILCLKLGVRPGHFDRCQPAPAWRTAARWGLQLGRVGRWDRSRFGTPSSVASLTFEALAGQETKIAKSVSCNVFFGVALKPFATFNRSLTSLFLKPQGPTLCQRYCGYCSNSCCAICSPYAVK
jgi:hypothetical protein